MKNKTFHNKQNSLKLVKEQEMFSTLRTSEKTAICKVLYMLTKCCDEEEDGNTDYEPGSATGG
jgi:hypothetical protein